MKHYPATMSTTEHSRLDRLERQRRRIAVRESKSSPLAAVEIPSLAWLVQPSLAWGLASMVDLSGITFRVNPQRFYPSADTFVLGQDFRAIASDMRLAAEKASDTSDQQSLFDATGL
jgi:hypothetical protein